jgi:guanylate kinase
VCAVYAVVAEKIPQFRQLGFNETTTAFVTPPSFLEWMDRMDRHNVESDQLAKRLEEARRSFNFALNDNQTHFVLNDNLSSAVHQTTMLMNGEIDEAREQKAAQAAQKIYWELAFA